MKNNKQESCRLYREIYPVCFSLIPAGKQHILLESADALELFPEVLLEKSEALQLEEYLSELARLEQYVYHLKRKEFPVARHSEKLSINPSLELFENRWKNLSYLFEGREKGPDPEKKAESLLIWVQPASGTVRVKPVSDEDLLVLKAAHEELSVREVARLGNLPSATVEAAVIRALDEGIVTGPEPLIKRAYNPIRDGDVDQQFFAARVFTLQWHITQDCDLHCRHCYDRSRYKSLSLQQETAILDDFSEFCNSHNVHGQVTFTGGNPLLHPNFERLYREAAERGLSTAILGNPTTREKIERLNDIQPLAFYQVSLEGLEEHNDYMRGKGHFKKVLSFLALLQELGVYSMVMLTLTRKNMEQVLQLAEILRNRTDLFTFNRLSLTGEGANLIAVDVESYPDFLKKYAEAADSNQCLGLKDNLLNITYHEQNREPFGGCTGYGCGAAFNFMAVLADGTVHACRKFPSPLGNLMEQSFSAIYHSALADQYRNGAKECRACVLNSVCRGCLAVAHSHGLDIFHEKDPYCFFKC